MGEEREVKPLDINVSQAVALRKRSRWWLIPQIILPIAVIAGANFIAERLIASRPDVPQRPPREQVYIIKTQPVEFADHRPVLRAFGTLVAGRTIDLRALVAGEIVSVKPNLMVGARVEKGDVLVAIDRFDYQGAVTEARINLAEARARLAENRARVALEEDAIGRYEEQLDFARRDLERAERLVKSGNITQRGLDERRLVVSQRGQALEQRRNTVAIEKARVEQQVAGIERLEWKLAQAKRNLENTALIAPFSGIVTAENVEQGRLLNVNDVAVSLYEADNLEARFLLSDKQYGEIAADGPAFAGRQVDVVWNVGGAPVRVRAVVERVAAEIAPERGGVEVYARIPPQPTAIELRPGAFVEIRIPGRAFADTVRLPETAVYGGNQVFVVEDGRLAERLVAIKAYDDGNVIVAGDFKAGERVLLTRIAEVGKGLKVREPGVDKKPESGRKGGAGRDKTAERR